MLTRVISIACVGVGVRVRDARARPRDGHRLNLHSGLTRTTRTSC